MSIQLNAEQLAALLDYDTLRLALRQYSITDLSFEMKINYFVLQRFLSGSSPRPNTEMFIKLVKFVNHHRLVKL